MREPERIITLLDLLNEIWQEHPDLRFYQLIEILKYDYINDTGEVGWRKNLQVAKANGNYVYLESHSYIDLFNLEDDKFIDFLKTKLDKSNK